MDSLKTLEYPIVVLYIIHKCARVVVAALSS